MVQKQAVLSRELIIHPGEILKDVLDERDMKQKELSIRSGITESQIANIITGRRPISAATARKLQYALDIPAYFWINLQQNYDLELIAYEDAHNISKEEKQIYKNVKHVFDCFRQFGIVPETIADTSEGIIWLRNTLRISNLQAINSLPAAAAYRCTSNHGNLYVNYVWVYLCRILGERNNDMGPFDKEKLKESISDIKSYMFTEDATDMYRNIAGRLRECGVTFRIIPHCKNLGVRGFTEMVNGVGNVFLTIRDASADIFWFTLFHELGHLLQGEDKNETLADEFASEILITPTEYKAFLSAGDLSISAICSLARRNNVQPYIVIGRLQKEGRIPYNFYSRYKVKYVWQKE